VISVFNSASKKGAGLNRVLDFTPVPRRAANENIEIDKPPTTATHRLREKDDLKNQGSSRKGAPV
jgi:hypothetical protein